MILTRPRVKECKPPQSGKGAKGRRLSFVSFGWTGTPLELLVQVVLLALRGGEAGLGVSTGGGARGAGDTDTAIPYPCSGSRVVVCRRQCGACTVERT